MSRLKLRRPIVCLDIESTGVDVVNDRIIELALVKIYPDFEQDRDCMELLLNPGIPIPEGATAVHGITDDKVKDCRFFKEVGQGVYNFLNGCDYLGFNLLAFDLPMLDGHLREFCGLELPDGEVIDAGNIFKKKEERTLSAAVKFYTGRDHEGAHGALPDVLATVDVLFAQMDRYEDLPEDSSELAKFSQFKPMVDWAGKFAIDEDGDYIYNFSKNKGQKVKHDIGLCEWMLMKDFPENTKKFCRQFISEYYANR